MNGLSLQQRVAAYLLLTRYSSVSDSSSSSSSSSDSSDSSSTSSSDDDILMIVAAEAEHPTVRTQWWERDVPQFDDQQFKDNFRLTRDSFNALSDSLSALWVKPGLKGRSPVNCDKALAVVLWRLANTVTYREVGVKFGMERAHVQRLCRRMMRCIYTRHHELIRMPATSAEWESVRRSWAPSTLPNTVGALDGTHLPLVYAPVQHHKAYFNRKSFYSIQMQAIVDHRHLFRDIAVGAEGSAADGNVWARCTAQQHIAATIPPHHYILADSAYPSLPWLVVPYKEIVALTSQQKRFNRSLSSSRVAVEITFGKTKARWRCLNGLRWRHLQDARYVAWSCCILHNWCVLNDDDVFYEWMEQQSRANAAQAGVQQAAQQAAQQPAHNYDAPTLLELYIAHQQQLSQLVQQPPLNNAPHNHVQLQDLPNQPAYLTLFLRYFARNPNNRLTADEARDVGLHLRRVMTAQF
jgi:DDE superfamily endonuclease